MSHCGYEYKVSYYQVYISEVLTKDNLPDQVNWPIHDYLIAN